MSDDSTHNPSHRPAQAAHGHGAQAAERIDVRERGAAKDGEPQLMDRRLFMQLAVFECGPGADPAEVVKQLGAAMEGRGISAVIYEDVNDPRGIGLLTFNEDPAVFVSKVRPALHQPELSSLRLRPEFTMLGRTYSGGYEDDLKFWILDRPRNTVLNPEWNWAVWYPLRRTGEFARLGRKEQADILREHAALGRVYGEQDLAYDVRLACHGLDARDYEFVIGLVGRDLHPLSHVVQRMRRTRQTSQYIAQMGPFFVGRAALRVAAG